MFKILSGSDSQLESVNPFKLASFTEEIQAAEKHKKMVEEEFKPSFEKKVDSEFILGGFDFEYGGGYRRDEILKKTSDEAEAVIREAKERVAEIEREGFQKGHEEGRQQGKQESFHEVTSLMNSLREGVASLNSARMEYYGKAEKEMVDLVALIASEIVCREIRQDKMVIVGVIRKAVEEIRTKQSIIIRLNPREIEIGLAMKEDLVKEVEAVGKVEIRPDTAISQGGCAIETNIGILDATVETRLMALHKTLKEQIGK